VNVNHSLHCERSSTFALLLLSLGLAEAGQTAIGGEIGARILGTVNLRLGAYAARKHTRQPEPMRLSKSKFVAGVQCLKRLYFQVHEPELAAEPDASGYAIMDQGQEVGMLARQLFPGGVEVDGSAGLDEAIRTTRELVANPEVPAIFEATFENGGVLVRVDILQRRRDNRWRLIEVKSTTDLKEEHLDDVGIQSHVVSRSGLDLASSCLMHVNRGYVFEGGAIDVRQFFKIRNLTRRIARLDPKLTSQLRAEFTVLNMPKAPDISAGRHCTDPVTCEFYDRCNPPRPDDHIGYIPRIQASAVEELAQMGVESIHDIPDDFPLNERQRLACNSVQTGQPWFSPGLKELIGLKYPLFFMDFETVNPAIPRFAGMRPYDQLSFQWSVHVQRKPSAEPEHYEFLATDASDPRLGFITSLCGALGEKGSIVVYNQPFEEQRLSELAAWLPEFSGQIKKIQRRLWDLLPLVRNHVYHPAFAGSFSLKAVLPALVPELTYEGMEVANGQDAGLAWKSFIQGGLDRAEHERVRKALLDYCGQDTLALVKLVEKLRGAST
jgi:predicted RecB family nuclease